MSFVVGLCALLGLVSGVIVYLLFRRRTWLSLVAAGLVFAGSLAWFLSPVCRPIADQDLARFDPPIETRTATGMAGQRYFQQRDGAWFQCKARIARQLFF